MTFLSGAVLLLAIGVSLALLGGAGLHIRIARLERALARGGGAVGGEPGPAVAQRPQVLFNEQLAENIFHSSEATMALFATDGCAACGVVVPEFDRLANDARYAEVAFVLVSPLGADLSSTDGAGGARRVEARRSLFSELAGPVIPSVTFRGSDGTVSELGPVGSSRALDDIVEAAARPSSHDVAK